MSQQDEYSFDQADRNADSVISEYGRLLAAGQGGDFKPEFEALHKKAFEYRQTRRTANNRREMNMLTPEWEAEELEKLRKFEEAFKKFHSMVRRASS